METNNKLKADNLRELVKERTGINPKEIVCPREKTFMTPCVVRDGNLAMTNDEICVGCGASVLELLEQEKSKY